MNLILSAEVAIGAVFLGAVVSSVVFGGAATPAAASSPEINDGEIESKLNELETTTIQLEKEQKRKFLSVITSDSGYQNIEAEISNNTTSSITALLGESDVYKAGYKKQEWKFAHIPYRIENYPSADSGRVDAGVIWSTRQERDSIGYINTLKHLESSDKTKGHRVLKRKTNIDEKKIKYIKEN